MLSPSASNLTKNTEKKIKQCTSALGRSTLFLFFFKKTYLEHLREKGTLHKRKLRQKIDWCK